MTKPFISPWSQEFKELQQSEALRGELEVALRDVPPTALLHDFLPKPQPDVQPQPEPEPIVVAPAQEPEVKKAAKKKSLKTLPFRAFMKVAKKPLIGLPMLGGALFGLSPLSDPTQADVDFRVECEFSLSNGKNGMAVFASHYDHDTGKITVDKDVTDPEFFKGVTRPDMAADTCKDFLNDEIRYHYTRARLTYSDGTLYGYEIDERRTSYDFRAVVGGMSDLQDFIRGDYEAQTGDYKYGRVLYALEKASEYGGDAMMYVAGKVSTIVAKAM